MQKKEQEVRHSEFLNSLMKSFNLKQTELRKEHERISAEIQLKFKHNMSLLRSAMESKR